MHIVHGRNGHSKRLFQMQSNKAKATTEKLQLHPCAAKGKDRQSQGAQEISSTVRRLFAFSITESKTFNLPEFKGGVTTADLRQFVWGSCRFIHVRRLLVLVRRILTDAQ